MHSISLSKRAPRRLLETADRRRLMMACFSVVDCPQAPRIGLAVGYGRRSSSPCRCNPFGLHGTAEDVAARLRRTLSGFGKVFWRLRRRRQTERNPVGCRCKHPEASTLITALSRRTTAVRSTALILMHPHCIAVPSDVSRYGAACCSTRVLDVDICDDDDRTAPTMTYDTVIGFTVLNG